MLLPDGAPTADMSELYRTERTLGFKIKASWLKETIGHPGFAALTMRSCLTFDRPSPTWKIGISP
jgi:hypothetical protein